MLHFKPHIRKPSKAALCLLLSLAFLAGLLLGILHRVCSPTDRRFEAFTNDLFLAQVTDNTLNLHYTLADPHSWGIEEYRCSLGSPVLTDPKSYFSSLENSRRTLASFSDQTLSPENQLTADILALYFDTELSLGRYYILSEVLSPSLGLQAQLPLLLSEYHFRTKTDIMDYLQLLTQIPHYFDEIIAFERKKAARGCFMNDNTVRRITEQCADFISSGQSNCLHTMFLQKAEQSQLLSDSEKQAAVQKHAQLLQECVIPAYESLITSLNSLAGSGTNPGGLSYYDGGRAYYEYLIRSECGIYASIDDLRNRLISQLHKDCAEIRSLLDATPSLAASLFAVNMRELTPQQMLQRLQQQMLQDFPELPTLTYDVRYVHDDLKEHLSPAFYLTPPLDTKSPNTIYLNPASGTVGIELYATLAHEGFPGHLYQTNYFSRTEQPPIRHLLGMGGYIEGWATYIESYAYTYAGLKAEQGRLLWLNRSVNLCLYSLLDLGIHYYGWTASDAAHYLERFGITDTAVAAEIFQYIVETPANYLKYYGGCLAFMDLKERLLTSEKAVTPLDFHRAVLEIGPCQFPILEQYAARYLS